MYGNDYIKKGWTKSVITVWGRKLVGSSTCEGFHSTFFQSVLHRLITTNIYISHISKYPFLCFPDLHYAEPTHTSAQPAHAILHGGVPDRTSVCALIIY